MLRHRSNLVVLRIEEGHMKQFRPLASLVAALPMHLSAGLAALLYSGLVHETSLKTSAVQFVGPLVVVLLAHLAWLASQQELKPGFSMVLLRRSLQTSTGLLVLVTLAAIYMPMPAGAQGGPGADVIGPILTILFCLFVVALVVTVLAGVVYLLGRAASALYVFVTERKNRKPGDTRLFDAAVTTTALVVLVVASVEGVTRTLSFGAVDGASVTLAVAAPPERVWLEVGRATSPAFPLPMMLKSIPQPMAVLRGPSDGSATTGASSQRSPSTSWNWASPTRPGAVVPSRRDGRRRCTPTSSSWRWGTTRTRSSRTRSPAPDLAVGHDEADHRRWRGRRSPASTRAATPHAAGRRPSAPRATGRPPRGRSWARSTSPRRTSGAASSGPGRTPILRPRGRRSSAARR